MFSKLLEPRLFRRAAARTPAGARPAGAAPAAGGRRPGFRRPEGGQAGRASGPSCRRRPAAGRDAAGVRLPARTNCRAACGVADTDNVSAHPYDPVADGLIAEHPGGLLLDCGAGLRPVYHDNVVNFEIVDYPTTDVRGVGERLPFKDGVFDAAFSLSVSGARDRDPFACARRDRPGAASPAGRRTRGPVPPAVPRVPAPLLQHDPRRGWRTCSPAGSSRAPGGERRRPADFALAWMLERWAARLPPPARRQFLSLRVADLTGNAATYLNQPYVTALPDAANFELAATTTLIARKPDA